MSVEQEGSVQDESLSPSSPETRQKVVAVASSAGGLYALSVILAMLPVDFPAPIVVAQHLSPNRKSLLADILNRHCLLPVKEAQEGNCLRAGWVYISPGGSHLLVNADLSLSLSHAAKVNFSRPSADVLFTSEAANVGRGGGRYRTDGREWGRD